MRYFFASWIASLRQSARQIPGDNCTSPGNWLAGPILPESTLVEIAGIDAFSGKPELQHVHLLWTVKHLARKKDFRQQPHPAKRHTQHHGEERAFALDGRPRLLCGRRDGLLQVSQVLLRQLWRRVIEQQQNCLVSSLTIVSKYRLRIEIKACFIGQVRKLVLLQRRNRVPEPRRSPRISLRAVCEPPRQVRADGRQRRLVRMPAHGSNQRR